MTTPPPTESIPPARWYLDTIVSHTVLVDAWGTAPPIRLTGDFATIARAVAGTVQATDIVIVNTVGVGLSLAAMLEEVGVRVAHVCLAVRQGAHA